MLFQNNTKRDEQVFVMYSFAMVGIPSNGEVKILSGGARPNYYLVIDDPMLEIPCEWFAHAMRSFTIISNL